MDTIDKLAWIELRDKKILSTRSKGKQVYYLPGGKRELGETDHEALKREITEELDVQLIDDSIEFLGIFQAQADGKPQGVDVKMTCYTARYVGHLKASSEIAEIVWLTYQDRDKTSPVDQIIFDWLKAKDLLV